MSKNRKWLRLGKVTGLREVTDIERWQGVAASRVFSALESVPDYSRLVDVVAADPILKDASSIAGGWGKPKALLDHCIVSSLLIRGQEMRVDAHVAVTQLRRFRQAIQSDRLQCRGTARILGLHLNCKSIRLGHGLELVRLTQDERNERQPLADARQPNLITPSDLLNHHAELRVAFNEPVNRAEPIGLLKAESRASSKLYGIVDSVIDSLRLLKPGDIECWGSTVRAQFLSTMAYSHVALPIYGVGMHIGKKDCHNLALALRIITKTVHADAVLQQAINRFLVAKTRVRPIDRMVDFAIAWESLLLTSKGDEPQQELSYRFRLNGSSVLSKATKGLSRTNAFSRMKSVYDVRSAIVHGGLPTKIEKRVKSNGFASLEALAAATEADFRNSVIWMNRLNVKSRPYNCEGGWERLLWSK